MASSKMPRRFWSYTAGKGNPRTEEMAAARERKLQELRQTLPGLLAFGGILLLAYTGEGPGFMRSMAHEDFAGRDALRQTRFSTLDHTGVGVNRHDSGGTGL